MCKGNGYYLLANDQHPRGIVKPCPRCANLLSRSRLRHNEQSARLEDIAGRDTASSLLRDLGRATLVDPFGWLFLWGGTGSAKTLFLHALVAGFCNRGVQAMYYHARDLQDGFYRDIHSDDSANDVLYRRVPVLAIDELDKYHFTDWSRSALQTMLDSRYRDMSSHFTVFAANRDPLLDGADAWLPEDIRSRLTDGRFRRHLPNLNLDVTAVIHCAQGDMRPSLIRTAKEQTP